jgi:hypothetical protein
MSKTVTIQLQINGKSCGTINVSPSSSAKKLENMALSLPHINEVLKHKRMVKIVVVIDKLVNIVVADKRVNIAVDCNIKRRKMSKKVKTLKSKLNAMMADSILKSDQWNDTKLVAKWDNINKNQPKLFKNLKATKMDSRSSNYKKLYASLIPFLKEANLYDKLQKIIRENKFISGGKTTFDLAVYLIGQEFGVLVNKPSHFDSFVIDGQKDQKIKRH